MPEHAVADRAQEGRAHCAATAGADHHEVGVRGGGGEGGDRVLQTNGGLDLHVWVGGRPRGDLVLDGTLVLGQNAVGYGPEAELVAGGGHRPADDDAYACASVRCLVEGEPQRVPRSGGTVEADDDLAVVGLRDVADDD